MNSFERLMTALGHKEADRVPLLLFFTFYGAKELGIPIKDYFSKAENVVEGQVRLRKKFEHDCFYPFFYGAAEAASFGQGVEFYDDGPPNALRPVIRERKDIFTLHAPEPLENKALAEAAKAVKILADEHKGKVPIIAAVIGPFSLPIMLMGMNNWLEIFTTDDKEAIEAITSLTSSFCLKWTNTLFEHGADAVGFFEPFASTTMVTRNEFSKYIYEADKELISKFKGPVAFCGAGGRLAPIMDMLTDIGAAGCALSTDDDLSAIKKAYGDKINILGNLNNVEMVNWSYEDAKANAAKCLKAAKQGGGFVLTDQHGEISWAVDEKVFYGIRDAVNEFGVY